MTEDTVIETMGIRSMDLVLCDSRYKAFLVMKGT